MDSIDYKSSGVDIVKGDAFVEWIKETQPKKQPHQDKIIDGLGGFAGVFRANFKSMEEPCLVASTDGIGTKLLLGEKYNRIEDLGQDLVAMCVNDLVCLGAEPLFFLDYYACGKLDLEKAKAFVTGVRNACLKSNLFLLGGETAEMPGLYSENQFDGAGFAVGVVDKKNMWGKHNVKAGQKLIAVESSGFHSNGYSLLRKVFEADLDQWIDMLLKPTHLYAEMTEKFKSKKLPIMACANITGGGMSNIPRCLDDSLQAVLKPWILPKAFQEVLDRTKAKPHDFYETLNCGVGFVVIVEEKDEVEVMDSISSSGFKCWDLGHVAEKSKPLDPEWVFG
jgi:phosphoribosylformylglycinamidine cyclo-ligase